MRHRINSSIFNEDILSTLYTEKKKGKDKICFSSGKEREVLTGGHSRFECEHHREVRDVGPGSYNIENITSAFSQFGKVTSNAGYGGLASKTCRFGHHLSKDTRTKTTSVKASFRTKSVVGKKKARKTGKPPPPFGSAIPRKTGVFGKKEDTPGFVYDINRAHRRREMTFDHSFGGRTRLRPLVLWKCTPENTDTCGICQKKTIGDYYINRSEVLCLNCFNSEWAKPRKYSQAKLRDFKVIRDCSEIHEHGGTTAAVPLVSNKDIRKQRLLESYFGSFASPRKIIHEVKKISKPKSFGSTQGGERVTVIFESKQRKDTFSWSA